MCPVTAMLSFLVMRGKVGVHGKMVGISLLDAFLSSLKCKLLLLHVMPRNCSIPGCTSRSDKKECEHLSFHKLPTDFDRRHQWLVSIKRPIRVSPYTYICNPTLYTPSLQFLLELSNNPAQISQHTYTGHSHFSNYSNT